MSAAGSNVPFSRVGVLGCGLMGAGIAEVCARAGYDTVVREVSEELLRKGAIEAILGVMFEELREKRFAPPPLLRRLVQAGRLGRKTGRGFFAYPTP